MVKYQTPEQANLVESALLRQLRSSFDADLLSLTQYCSDTAAFVHSLVTRTSDSVERFRSPPKIGSCSEAIFRNRVTISISNWSLGKNLFRCRVMEAEQYCSYMGVPISSYASPVFALEMMSSVECKWGEESIALARKISSEDLPMLLEGQDLDSKIGYLAANIH